MNTNPYEPPRLVTATEDPVYSNRILAPLSDLVRIIARTCSYLTLLVTLCGYSVSSFRFEFLVLKPHDYFQISRAFLSFGGIAAFVCILICFIAWILSPWSRLRHERPLWPTIFCIAISLYLGLPGVE